MEGDFFDEQICGRVANHYASDGSGSSNVNIYSKTTYLKF
jgi:hypothetical protein